MKFEDVFPGERFGAERIEFRRFLENGLDETDGISWLKTLVAFANTSGGHLYVGVDDSTHELKPLAASLASRQMRLIRATLRDRSDPPLKPEIKAIPVSQEGETRYLIDVYVPVSPYLPVMAKDKGNYFAYVRSYGATQIAGSEEIRNLVYRSENTSFDTFPTEEIFDPNQFKELFRCYKERNGGKELTEKALIAVHFMDAEGHLSRGARLFKDGEGSSLTALSVAKFPGIDSGSAQILNIHRYHGPITKTILEATSYIQDISINGIVKRADGDEKLHSYPLRSVQEGIANAFAHRNYWIAGSQIQISIYKDRMEIVSPGSLVSSGGLAKTQDLRSLKPVHRNEMVCSMLMLCRLIQGLGSGFDIIESDYLSQDDAHKPWIESDSSSFTLALPDITYAKGVVGEHNEAPDIYVDDPSLSLVDRDILAYCYPQKRSIKEIAAYLGKSVSTYLRETVIGALIEKGYLVKVDVSPLSVITVRSKVFLR